MSKEQWQSTINQIIELVKKIDEDPSSLDSTTAISLKDVLEYKMANRVPGIDTKRRPEARAPAQIGSNCTNVYGVQTFLTFTDQSTPPSHQPIRNPASSQMSGALPVHDRVTHKRQTERPAVAKRLSYLSYNSSSRVEANVC